MVEEILKNPKFVHMTMKDFSGFSCNKKQNSFKKSEQRKNKVGKGNSKDKGECFIYSKKENQKKEPPNFLKKKKGMTHSLFH